MTSAVVVTHQSAGEVAGTLTSLRDAGLDVVVVDNASTDGTPDLVRRDFLAFTLLANPVNVGFAAAVNQALALLEGPAVLLVNPDCVLPPATARALLAHLETHREVGVVGPRLVGADGRVAASAHPFETLTSVVLSRFGGTLLPVAARRLVSGPARRTSYDACRTGSAPVAVDWLSGACLAVRTDLLRTTGGLDERYFLYYEDEELCWQAREHGWAVHLLPAVTATHVGGASSTATPGATWPALYRSMLIFFASHRAPSYAGVRAAVRLRAGVGVLLGGARRLLGDPTGVDRVRAWRAVAVVGRDGVSA